MCDEEGAPEEGGRDEVGGDLVDHVLIVEEDVLQVGVSALVLHDLLYPGAVTSCTDYWIDNAPTGTAHQGALEQKQYELLPKGLLYIQIGDLFGYFILGQHQRIVGLAGFEVNHVADDEVEPQEQDQHEHAGHGNWCGDVEGVGGILEQQVFGSSV